MSNCGMPCFPAKHATLINNCYPTIPGESHPRSNELSYLQFYAESRPEKLTKVGFYLEKRVESDLWKKRADFVQVSMEIWKSLLTTSPSQVNLFAEPLLKTIKAVITSEDTSSYHCATQTFSQFCQVNGKMTLLPDTEMFALYYKIIEIYCDFAANDKTNLEVQTNLRQCGIEALVAVSRSDILHNSDSKTIIKLLVPAFIINITAPVTPVIEGPPVKAMVTNEVSTPVSAEELNRLASHGFSDLAKKGSVIHLRFTIDCIFNFIEEKNYWSKNQFVIELIQLISVSAQPQFRYIPVAVVLKLLEVEENAHNFVKMQCLVGVLESLLDKRHSLVGISVLEILNTLVQQLVGLPGEFDIVTGTPTNPSMTAAQSLLIQTVGKLGAKIYYSDQIMDVLSYLVNKLKIGSKDDKMGSISTSTGRVLVLRAMTEVLKAHHNETLQKPSKSKATISLNVFTSTISLLLSEAPLVRLEFFHFIYELIKGLNDHERISKSHEMDFLSSLHRALFDCASNTNNLPMDYHILYHILTSLYPGLGEPALIRTVPLIFRLQALEADETDTQLLHHLALSSVVLNFFVSSGKEIPCQPLETYISEIKSMREKHSQYLAGFEPIPPTLVKELLNTSFSAMFKDSPVSSLKIVDKFVEPETVSEILLASPDLEYFSDDTKQQLLEEYNPESSKYDFQESKFRVRQSRSVRSHNKDVVAATPPEPLRIVRIENLKDALSVPQDVSDLDSDSDVQSPSIATSKKSPRELSSRVDVNNLLQSITSSNTGRKSAHSLVSGPYQNL